jgi:murein DD-endopeptidase MepM/ murein hydrolase activator NlpD
MLASSCTPAMLIGIDARGAPALPDRAETTPSARPGGPPQLVMPVAGVRVADVTSNFGARRGARRHEGMDIFAPRGTPVKSAAAGTVRFAGTTERGGWTVWIRSSGWDVWYTHLHAIAPGLREGSTVRADTLLGWVGNTGNASGGATHLHLELASTGGPVDPLPFLDDRN